MGEKITLKNNIILKFETTKIEILFKGLKLSISYPFSGNYNYSSLIILTANEENLEKANKIIAMYKEVPSIREVVIVGNKNHNLKELNTTKLVKFVEHKKNKTPLITSVKEALSCVSNFSDFAIICPANKKHIKKAQLEKVLNFAIKNKVDFVAPICCGKKFHPIVVSREGFLKIKGIRKELGFKYISKNLFEEVTV